MRKEAESWTIGILGQEGPGGAGEGGGCAGDTGSPIRSGFRGTPSCHAHCADITPPCRV